MLAYMPCQLGQAKVVVGLTTAKTNTNGMPLFTDSKTLYITKRGVITCKKYRDIVPDGVVLCEKRPAHTRTGISGKMEKQRGLGIR
jgi:hypothetical protein